MRLILIDNDSGYIFADTADLDTIERGDIVTPEFAIDAFHDSIREPRHVHLEESGKPFANATGYHVYRADVNGSDAVVVVTDGQDPEAIEAVERDCDYLGFWARVAEGRT